jgi:DNA-binding beta-propeller fold protein YncE
LSRSLTPISIIKSSAKFFVILAALVAIIGCGDGITGQVGGIGEDAVIWGTEGSGDGQFQFPVGVAVALDGSVYVVDSYNDRIQKFTSEGVFVSQWGTEGSGDGEFNRPNNVAVASDGSVYVSERSNQRIE